jgi:Spy/CpxP family protein refolding chaperone
MLEVKMRTLMLLFAAVLFLTATSFTYAQDPTPVDQIQQLNLAPEQRQKIRMIFEENKGQRQTINRRVREANIALDQALDMEPVDEALVEQRINELATAQGAQLRMRIQTEMKIRRELRPEQLATLRQLRLQVRDFRGAQRPLNQRPARPNRRNIPPQ